MTKLAGGDPNIGASAASVSTREAQLRCAGVGGLLLGWARGRSLPLPRL